MSIRSAAITLGEAGSIPEAEAAGTTGLFFVLNGSFLQPFRVLIYSLVKCKSLLDLPVVVISEDPRVADDPLVATIADRFVLAGEREIAQFARISGHKVAKPLKLDWIAKYTFLKWLVFERFGFKRHVYLDADILCLNPCDELAGMGEADLYAGPIFGKELNAGPEGELLSLSKRDAAMRAFLGRRTWRSLNSGVLVLNGRTLDPAFRQALIERAEAEAVPVEQLVIRRHFRDNPDHAQSLISPLFNFNHGYLARLSVPMQLKLLGRIKLLHFVGGGIKPWSQPEPAAGGDAWITDTIWRAYAEEARHADPIFGGA